MSLTAHRISQYIALILIFTALAGGYWYWKSQAAVKINQGLEDSLEQGLVGYWKLDDASGTTATDSSGNGNNGTLTNGSTWTTGQIIGGVDVDGTDDYVTIADPASGILDVADGVNFTLSGWFNRDTFTTDDTLLSKRNGIASTDTGYLIYVDDATDKLTFEVADGTDEYQMESGSTFTAAGWSHFVIVWDDASSARTKMFINGSLQSTTNTGTFGNVNSLANTVAFNLGAESDAGNPYDGKLDEARTYNRALTDEEVMRLYQTTAPQGIDTGLIGYWPLDGDDISGTTAYDRSGKGNHGTITAGITKVSGKADQALDFSSGNGVRIDSLTQTGQTYTFATWAKVTSCSNEYIFDTVAGRFVLACAGRTISYYDGTWKSVGSANSIPLNEWVHLVWVLNSSNSTATGYINGVSVGTNSYVGQNIGTTTRIGSYYDAGAAIVQGALDDFRIYNRAFTAAEVQDLYQKTQSDTVGASNRRDSLEQGLVGYWKLDDASGTTATDSSGNGNNGTLTNGPTWGTGQVRGGVSFDGVDDRIVSVSNSPQIASLTKATVSFWINPTQIGGIFNTLEYDGGGNGFFGNGFEITSDVAHGTQTIRLAVDGTTGDMMAHSTAILPLSTWTHVTVVWDGTLTSTGTKFYYNGGIAGTTGQGDGSGTYVPSDGRFKMGVFTGGNNPLNGSLDEVRIYNRTLTDEEVRRLYRTAAPTEVDTGLKGYWSFDGRDISGTAVYDRSGVGNHGTSSGGPVAAAGRMGQALQFDGVNDCVLVPDAAPLRLAVGGKMSIGLWYKSDISSGSGALYQKIDGSSSNQYGALVVGGTSSHTLTFYYRSDGAPNGIDAIQVPNIEKNVWHHVVSSYDTVSGVFTVFVDGVSVKTMTVVPGGTGIGSSNGLNIGSGNGCGQNFTGQLDELSIYNRILSVDEIRELYDYGKADKINTAASDPLADGLAGYWKLDDASGTTATDSSGNGHTGTLYNSPTWSTAGRVSGAVNFDGTNDYINIPSITAAQFGNTTFTFAGWIKTTGTDKYIAAQDYCNGGWGIWIDSFYKVFVGTRGAGACGAYTVYRYAVSAITPNEWHHITAVIKTDTSVVANNAITIYIDGALNQDTPIVGSSPYGATGASGLQISGRYINDLLFSGPMDEIRLYNRGLSAEEVRQLYRTTAPTGVDTGLVGYWSFNGADVSGTTAYDRSGKGNNGTLTNGPSAIAGKIGQALRFDGVDDSVSVSSSSAFDIGTQATYAAWVKINTLPGAAGFYVMRKWASGQEDKAIYIPQAGTPGFYLNGAFGGTWLYAKTVLTPGDWHLVVGTYESSNAKIYVDGILDNSKAVSGSVSNYTGPFAFGSSVDVGNPAYLNGAIDEVRLYNRALTAAEIQNLYFKGR